MEEGLVLLFIDNSDEEGLGAVMATAVNGILLVGPLVKYYGACPRRWLAVFFALCQYLFTFYLLPLPFTFTFTSTFTFTFTSTFYLFYR